MQDEYGYDLLQKIEEGNSTNDDIRNAISLLHRLIADIQNYIYHVLVPKDRELEQKIERINMVKLFNHTYTDTVAQHHKLLGEHSEMINEIATLVNKLIQAALEQQKKEVEGKDG